VRYAIGWEIGWVCASESDPAEDDIQAIRRIASGDRQALTALYLRYQQPLFRYLLQLTPDRGLAEELLQDTLVAVWRSAKRFEGRSSVQTWLLGIARRQAHNTLRQRGQPLADASALIELPATDPQPEEAALASFAREELADAFGRLSPVQREVLALTFVDELTYKETAQVLGVPVGTVKSRLSHARRALRMLLDARKGTER
jgi:RNA polymerase sigma-70 factor (ECF subfamily)